MKIAVCTDLHAPFHNQRALALFIKVVKAWKPDVLVNIGDLADFFAVSRYDKDPRKDRGLKHELVTVKHILDRLDPLAPRKIFICGNHEERLNKYLLKNAPALSDYVTVESALELAERGWEYYPYQEPCTIGGISFVHDLGYAGKTALRQTIDAFPANLVMGHSHRFESLTRGNLRRDTMTISSFGWMGNPREIDYLPSVKVKQDWTTGFGLVRLDGNHIHVQPVKVTGSKCMVDGRIYVSG